MNGVRFSNLTVDQLREELLKLQTLAVAVGSCDIDNLPDAVVKAWQAPLNYRDDELMWLRDKYVSLVGAAANVLKHHDAVANGERGDSTTIERLRRELIGQER